MVFHQILNFGLFLPISEVIFVSVDRYAADDEICPETFCRTFGNGKVFLGCQYVFLSVYLMISG